MIETTVESELGIQKLREFIGEEFLAPKVDVAIRNPDTKEVRAVKVGRNEPCPCGSGEKFKKCCFRKVGCGLEVVK